LSNPASTVKGIRNADQKSEDQMAEHQDITEATDTYSGFLKLFKWGTALSVLTAAIVVLIIS
jgi:hypothetical protein